MKETTGNEQLKAALALLAAELESSKNNEKLTMEALNNIFPFPLYISLRPDVNEKFDGNREDILNHFIHKGLYETDLKKELQRIEDELNYKNDRLDLLAKEFENLKKELYDSRTKGQGAEGKEKNEHEHTTLLEIHQKDTTYSSDKWEHYFSQYEQELERFRFKDKTRLLEIGVQNGGSLECWAKYLGPTSEIVGIDIDTKTTFLEYEGSIKNYVGDATDPTWLELLCSREPDFDIIIDDGSHVSEDIIQTFVYLFKKIKPGGIYIGEDLHACYWSSHHGSLPIDADKKSAITFFKEIIDFINIEHWIDRSDYDIFKQMPMLGRQNKLNDELRLLLNSIDSIKFSNSMVFIRKSYGQLSMLGRRIVADGETIVNPKLRKYI